MNNEDVVVPMTKNAPVASKADIEASEQWASDGTITFEYLTSVLGDQAASVSPQRQTIVVLTEEELRQTEDPFPDEPDWP